MKRSALRSFGIAFISIGVLLTYTNPTSHEKFEEEQYKKKITQLEQQLKEANELITELEHEKAGEPDAQQPAASTSGPQDEYAVMDTLYNYSGLKPAEIAQQLKDMKIIDDSMEMELYLTQPKYAASIQKGQFQLNSNMTIKEIADIITGKTETE